MVNMYINGIGDKSLPIHSNKNTGKVTTPVHQEHNVPLKLASPISG